MASRCVSRCGEGEMVAMASFWLLWHMAGLSTGRWSLASWAWRREMRWALVVAAVLVAVVAAVAGWLERGRTRWQRENLRI